MEAIGAAASLIAVLQLTSALISICYDYRHGNKAASREVLQISDELHSLKDVLDALLRLLEKSGDELGTFELLVKEAGPLGLCQEELKRLRVRLEPETGWVSLPMFFTSGQVPGLEGMKAALFC